MDTDLLGLAAVICFVLIGVKSILVGQYWPWQYKERCPFCKREWNGKEESK